MISHVSGKLVEKTPTRIVIETSGVGFGISIPLSSFEIIGDPGEHIKVLTHLHVREDALQLFGFATEMERELFQHLISVSGVGPKLAQGVLSGISVEKFKEAIQREDLAALSRISGIGKKTAERLVLELRDKIGDSKQTREGVPRMGASPIEEEAVLALVSLGYKRVQAKEKIVRVLKEDDSISVEELLRRALRGI